MTIHVKSKKKKEKKKEQFNHHRKVKEMLNGTHTNSYKFEQKSLKLVAYWKPVEQKSY